MRKYAAENGNTATVRKFRAEVPRLDESIVREFKKKYNIEIVNAAKVFWFSELIPDWSATITRRFGGYG